MQINTLKGTHKTAAADLERFSHYKKYKSSSSSSSSRHCAPEQFHLFIDSFKVIFYLQVFIWNEILFVCLFGSSILLLLLPSFRHLFIMYKRYIPVHIFLTKHYKLYLHDYMWANAREASGEKINRRSAWVVLWIYQRKLFHELRDEKEFFIVIKL